MLWQTVKPMDHELRTMYDRLLIAIDGSDEATHAAEYALALADTVGAAVDVVYVIPKQSLRMTRTTRERNRLHARGEALLAAIENIAAAHDAAIETHVAEGTPAAEISTLATERDADLIVVGRQGMTGVGKRLLGGITERVLSRSEVPICVVPFAESTPAATTHDRLLVPTDGSDNAAAAVPHAAAMAAAYDAAVHVLNVVDLQAVGGPFNAGGLDSTFLDRLEATGQEAADAVAADIAEAGPDIDVETAVKRTASFDGAAAGIEGYVESNDIDLIVMGSHGRSNLRRQLLGSVASAVLRTVDVPVVIAKQEASGSA